ncbi:TPA: tyrosine-type recombinase/integrase [Morganella morganii]|uniref:tyrosine-type recombinase/integrase n=1 Tax=Morganella morganii TaxID=582 RepID=UPI000DCBC365|nr:site-specific integrase [Morganella morganii]MBT0411971.1 tyrosine-type recombinase/integrase [Morganella morganii subsp. morganii]MBV0430674.1 tyrosine-type recombinase/integrase [Morganella morganii subsp. morganii]RAX24882.1 site-specific integrase [Morganella morganii]HCT2374332.1 tyrosine-type recombinase/integrase [Morganella morganii]
MAVNKLSDKKLKSLHCKQTDKQQVIADGNGLSARVSKTGTISFIFFYRLHGGKSSPVWLTLGKYPDLSLKAAREQRDKCRTWLAEGKDPRIQLKIIKEDTLKPVTVKNAIEYWINNYAVNKRKAAQAIRACFYKHVYKDIGDIPLNECSLTMWIKCFDKIKRNHPVQSGDILRISQQALKYCRVRKYAISHEIDDLKVEDVGKRSNRRNRVLTKDELRDLWQCINKDYDNNIISHEYRLILMFLVVFGCRMSEILLSTWDEWDFINNLWRVPPEHSKNGMEIIRPIPDNFKYWLLSLHNATKNRSHVIGFVMKQATVSSTIGQLWKRLNHKENWTAHDMRRVLATNLSDNNFEHNVVEQLLGHSLAGVAGIYNRSKYIEQKKEALVWWVDYLNSLIEKDEGQE